MVNKMKLGRDESEVKSNVGKSGGLRYAFFVHQKSKHVLSNVCTSSLFFIIMSMTLQELKKAWFGHRIIKAAAAPKCPVSGKKREDGWCWVYGGFIKTKEKKKQEQ